MRSRGFHAVEGGARVEPMCCGEERATRLGGCRQEGHYPGCVTKYLCHPAGLLAFPLAQAVWHIADLPETSAWVPGLEGSPHALNKHPGVKYQRRVLRQEHVIN